MMMVITIVAIVFYQYFKYLITMTQCLSTTPINQWHVNKQEHMKKGIGLLLDSE